MKRSEAIEKLQQYLEINSCYQIHPEQILKFVENLGMLPPKSSDGLSDDFGNEIHGPLYEWESENNDDNNYCGAV